MVVTNGAYKLMRDWADDPIVREYSLSSDWDDRWRTGGTVDEIMEEAHLDSGHVLEAIGLGPAGLASTVRFGLGRFTTREEIEKAAECIIAFVRRARAGQMAVEIHPEQ